MWLLLTVVSLISALGTTHGFLGKIAPESPEANMNIVSSWQRRGRCIKLRNVTTIRPIVGLNF
jgi:hypothetical protein